MVQSYGTVISNLVTSSGYLSSQESSDVENETEEIANIYQGRIIIVDKDLKLQGMLTISKMEKP